MIFFVFLNLLTVHCTVRNTGRYKNSNLLDIELLAIISQLEDRKKVCVENKPKFKKMVIQVYSLSLDWLAENQ